MENVSTRRQNFLSLSKLNLGLQELNYLKRVEIIATFEKKGEFILIVALSQPSPSALPKLPVSSEYPSTAFLNFDA